MRGGDIAMLSLDEGDQFEVEGSVEAGITGASWSPDESLLVLATGTNIHSLGLYVLIKFSGRETYPHDLNF